MWLPMSIILPFWFSLTLPQFMASLFASSMAYLVAGPTRTRLSYTMALSLAAAAICAVANLLLFTGRVPGITPVDDLAPPGGITTLLVEALAIGVVAGKTAVKGSLAQRRSLTSFWAAVLLSILAIVSLLWVGSALAPDLWFSPKPTG